MFVLANWMQLYYICTIHRCPFGTSHINWPIDFANYKRCDIIKIMLKEKVFVYRLAQQNFSYMFNLPISQKVARLPNWSIFIWLKEMVFVGRFTQLKFSYLFVIYFNLVGRVGYHIAGQSRI